MRYLDEVLAGVRSIIEHMPAGDDIDRLVAVSVCGFYGMSGGRWRTPAGMELPGTEFASFKPSQVEEDAMVVAKILKMRGYELDECKCDDDPHVCGFTVHSLRQPHTLGLADGALAEADTFPLALCRAALLLHYGFRHEPG